MIIFTTAWYILKAKFNKTIYQKWIDNLLSNVINFKLIIYTNKESYFMLEKYKKNDNIKIILLELEEFFNYKYKEFWINNHLKNIYLNSKVSWDVNMLWNEKIYLVKKSFKEKYFDGEWYGWIDIGYCRDKNLNGSWPNYDKINLLNKDKIYYAQVNGNNEEMNYLTRIILNKNINGLPNIEIPPNQVSIAGGFFLIYNTKIDWYEKIYTEKLKLYIDNNKLIKDDQIIVIDNIISNIKHFQLIKEIDNNDHWFLFLRYLN